MPDTAIRINPNDFQTLLARYVREHPTLCVPASIDEVARVTATSLNLEGFDVTAEELKERYGPPRSG